MITGISKTGTIPCEKCGSKVELDFSDSGRVYAACSVCNAANSYWSGYPKCEDLLERMGFRLFLDFDDQLMVESQSPVPDTIRKWLFENQGDMRRMLRQRNQVALSVYIGGTNNGQAHHVSRYSCDPIQQRHYCHIGPKHWEAYQFKEQGDFRLYFVGRATSEKKAKAGLFVPNQ